MMRRVAALLFLMCGVAASAFAAGQQASPHGAVPVVQTIRTTSPIVVDGRLDDEVWVRAPAATEFIQREPDEGKPATEATELRVAYDQHALYVGVRLRDREAGRI